MSFAYHPQMDGQTKIAISAWEPIYTSLQITNIVGPNGYHWLNGGMIAMITQQQKWHHSDVWSTSNISPDIHTQQLQVTSNGFHPSHMWHHSQHPQGQPTYSTKSHEKIDQSTSFKAHLCCWWLGLSLLKDWGSSKMSTQVFYDPYKTLQKIGSITYNLELLSWKLHPFFMSLTWRRLLANKFKPNLLYPS